MIALRSAKQTREWDAFTIRAQGLSSLDLMERAAIQLFRFVEPRLNEGQELTILAGPGNNGADGLALARLLPHKVTVYAPSEGVSEDHRHQYKRLENDSTVICKPLGAFLNDAAPALVVDGLFGSGLDRPLNGLYAEIVEKLNRESSEVISIDIPSGMAMDKTLDGPIVQATHTCSFQVTKRVFLHPNTGGYAGDVHVLDIGLDDGFTSPSSCFLSTWQDMIETYQPRPSFSHKGSFGHGLLVAGSKGMAGAAVLAGRSAVASGIGKLTLHLPTSLLVIAQTSVPEALAQTDHNAIDISSIPLTTNYQAIGVGPGIGTSEETLKGLRELLENYQKPMVIDADALNLMAADNTLLKNLPKHSILTPHPGEWKRLVGPWQNDFEKEEKLREYARTWNTYIVLKGRYAVLASPDGALHYNNTGNPALATAGTGDVLTGILTALLAQGYSPFDSARLGLWLHGVAADLFVEKTGADRMAASQFVEYLPSAWAQLRYKASRLP